MATQDKTGRPRHPDQLTPAEWRTVEGVRHGLTNAQIASRLDVTLDAVKFHVSNALSKLGMDTRADLRRWAGVRRDSRLAGSVREDNAPMTFAVGQIARHVRDLNAAVDWFARVLELQHLYTFGDLAFLACREVRLLLSQGDPRTNGLLYFATSDILAAHSRLVERGVHVIAAPHRIHKHPDGAEEWMTFFHDQDGGTLALMMITSAEPALEDCR